MPVYEAKEWTHLWYDEAKDEITPRAMLIGDSITAGYTQPVNRSLGNALRADSIAGSKGLDHPFYNEEVDLFARQFGFSYRIIHFNNGLHGFHLDAQTYGQLYEEKIIWLRARFPHAVLTLATSTSIVLTEGDRLPNPEKNAVVLARNEQVWRLADKYGLPVDDLYAAMLDHPEWRSGDPYHYNEQGTQAQGDLVAAFLLNHIK